jgi:hypothetical protein
VRSRHYAASILICVLLSSSILWTHAPRERRSFRILGRDRSKLSDSNANGMRFGPVATPSRKHSKMLLPVAFEPAPPQPGNSTEFVGRAGGATVMLTRDGMEFTSALASSRRSSKLISVHFLNAQRHGPARPSLNQLNWRGMDRLTGETNYFLGNDPARWRTHVPRFSGAAAPNVIPGVDAVAYGAGENLEYDLRVAPGTNPANLRLAVSGAERTRLDSNGDLAMWSEGHELRMRKPVIYEESVDEQIAPASNKLTNGSPYAGRGNRRVIDGGYALETDGTIGFRIGTYDPKATLVIDPSLSVGYATFLGGVGNDIATSVAVNATGKVYVGGTTTSLSTFAETSGQRLGSTGGDGDFFIAKIDPTKSGPDSLLYLTFIGGSGTEAGGEIAVDTSGNVALAGTTTSNDYPVTDSSTLTMGPGGAAVNDAAITEIDPTGAKLVYSTLFGGNGNEGTLATGGVAFDSSGNIFVGMDTQATNLTLAPTTTLGPLGPVYGGGLSDGFLAIFQPVVTGTTAHLKYCTYLGINAQATVTGVAVDTVGNAYLAGYTSDPTGTLATTNGFQTNYGGGAFNGFVMKILPSGMGASDLSYGTFLGGSGSDEVLAIAVGKELPGTAYVTGSTTSINFPVNGTIAPFQKTLTTEGNGNTNAFVAAIAQLPSGTTVLTYSTYLGGLQSDAGQGIFFAAPNQIYVAGSAKSWNFPWLFNFQPFSGSQDAFVAEMDPTSAGAASLLYATPIGGNGAPGVIATAQGNSIAADSSGNFYVAGATTAGDFPLARSANSGFQLTCASCQQTPPLSDAFLVQGQPSATATPSISFNIATINFGTQPVGSTTVPPGAVAAMNTGGAPLIIGDVSITGANAADFSLIGPAACTSAPVAPGKECSFEVGFVASLVGPEQAFLTFTDNGPENSQTVGLVGMGAGPFAMVSPLSVNFGNQPINTRSSTFQQVMLTNTGNQPLSFTQSLSGANASQFPPATADETCPSAANSELQPGASCVVPFYFAPTTTGTLTAQIVFVDNSGGREGTEQTVLISGVGTGAAPILGIAPASLSFGSQPVGITTATQNVTFTNNGSSDLNISSFAITGNDSTSFGYVAKGTNACTLPSGKLSAGSSCTLSVDFIPIATGPVTATLAISDNAQGSPQSVALSGNGGTTGISIAPTSVNFSSQTVGSPSAAVTVNVTNTGSSPIALAVAMVGANPADFMETDKCSQVPLGAGNSCIISVVFNPTQAGNRSAVIQISDNAPGNPQTIPLTGSAVQATASISPANLMLAFGSQLAGTTGTAAQTVTITNGGSSGAILTVSGATLNPATDFMLSNNCKSGLAAGLSCTMAVTFTPAAPGANTQCGSAAGAQTSVLNIIDNDPKSPQTLSLSGTSQDYCLVPTGANSVTVTSGSTGQFQLAAQSFGFAGSVALTCTASVPQGACSVMPTSVNLTTGATIPIQVNVTTTARPVGSIVGVFGSARDQTTAKFARVAVRILMLLMLGAIFMVRSMESRRNTMLRALQTCAILIVMSVGLAACFGGSQTDVVAPTGTAAGTYPITITATTTTSATRTIGLTLIVE